MQSWFYLHLYTSPSPCNKRKLLKSNPERKWKKYHHHRRGQCDVPLGMGQEALQWLWRRGSPGGQARVPSRCWGWLPTLLAPRHACASQVRNLYPQVSSCLRQGWGAVEWEQCPAKAPIPQPGAAWEGDSSAGRRGHEMGEAGKFQRVKVMLRRCGDTCGKDLGMALPEIIIIIY